MNDSTAVATRPATPLMAGGQVLPIIPKSVEEMFRLATAYTASGLAPKTLDTKEKVLIAIMAGAELGLPPHQAVQAFYVINNRPTIWGDAVPALLWANGFKIKEWLEGEGDQMIARCEITRPGGDVIPGEYSMDDAKKAKLHGKDGPWQTATKRMLKMRARAFAARDGASDVLKGFQIREEVEDYTHVRDVGPKTSGVMARLEAHGHASGEGFSQARVEEAIPQELPKGVEEIDAILEGDRIPEHDADTGEIIESETVREPAGDNLAGDGGDEFPGDRDAGFTLASTPDPEDWAIAFNGKLDLCADEPAIDALLADPVNLDGFRALEKAKPAMATALNAAITGRRKAMASRAKDRG